MKADIKAAMAILEKLNNLSAHKFPDPLPPLWYKSAIYPDTHLSEFCL